MSGLMYFFLNRFSDYDLSSVSSDGTFFICQHHISNFHITDHFSSHRSSECKDISQGTASCHWANLSLKQDILLLICEWTLL